MRKAIALTILGLVVLGATVISLYGVYCALAHPGFSDGMNQRAGRENILTLRLSQYIKDPQNFTYIPKRGWKCPGGRGLRGFEVEISEAFKEKVLNIIKADEDVQRLFNEGYNVSDIRVTQVRLAVQENGQITMEASNVLAILVNGNGSRACVEVDLKAGAVIRIILMSIKIIEKGASA